MKRLTAVVMAVIMFFAGIASAYAEQNNTPPAMPDGQGFPGGTPPEMPADGSFPELPEGMSFPDGQTPPGDFDFSSFPGNGFPGGGFPGSGGSAAEGQLGSWSMGGQNAESLEGADYAYDAALYVTADGIDAEKSATGRINGGSYDGTAASGITVEDAESGHNGVLVVDTEYTVSDAAISLITDADGTDTCDFSGKGAAIAAFGEGAKVTVENSTVHTAGVAATPIFADSGATVTIRSSSLQSDGGTLYSEYMNTPAQNLMVAPPWILGIMGTSRASNMMGDKTTVNVIDSETSAGAWAVLSTDTGTDMTLNVYNSSLTLNNADESLHPLQAEDGQISETLDNPYTETYGSGYGSFVIGNASETFAGAAINAGTYATIFNGGSAVYTALEAGKTYELKNSAGETTATYEAAEDKATQIHSDTFGFMAMQNTNTITVEKGTTVDSGYATFLIKTGYGSQNTTATVDEAKITNGGVLIQLIDNDDATNGGMMSTTDELNTNGGVQNFIPYHTEEAGFSIAAVTADSTVQAFAFTNGAYTGNIYNASGSDGLNASTLNVSFGENTEYSGAIASTSAIHVTYEGSAAVKENGGYAFDDTEEAASFAEKYQNTRFTINEYWGIGQVANLINNNGGNAINIALKDGAVWNVTGTSLISSLSVGEGCKVIVPEGVTLTVNGRTYTDCVIE